MADKTDLKDNLLQKANQFSFFQVVRLLRTLAAEKIAPSLEAPAVPDHIALRPRLSLAFQPSDVERIERVEHNGAEHFQVTVNFLGLYGTVSPLPTFYTEDLIDEASRDESVSRDFLDIINHRLILLFYMCWSKYRQYLKIAEEKDPTYIERLFCLLGLGDRDLIAQIDRPQRLLRYIGLFSQLPRSAAGLKALLRDTFDALPLSVQPCIARTARIPDDQQCRLGLGMCALGRDCHLGYEMKDRNGKFRIQIGPVDNATFRKFYPGSEDYKTLCFLTRLYVLDPLEYDIELILKEGEAQCVQLGDEGRALLGLNTWSFSATRLGEVRTLISPPIA